MKMNFCRNVAACLVVLAVHNQSFSAPAIDVGHISLLEDTPGQTIPLYVTGGDAVQGLNLNLSVESGGPELSTEGKIGPAITDVDVVTDTLFVANNDGQTTIASFPQAWVVSTATAIGTVSAEGVLAHVTFDTTGFLAGSGPFSFSLTDPLGTPTDFAGLSAELTAGQIQIVPEPSAVAVCLIGIVGFVAYGRRRTLGS